MSAQWSSSPSSSSSSSSSHRRPPPPRQPARHCFLSSARNQFSVSSRASFPDSTWDPSADRSKGLRIKATVVVDGDVTPYDQALARMNDQTHLMIMKSSTIQQDRVDSLSTPHTPKGGASQPRASSIVSRASGIVSGSGKMARSLVAHGTFGSVSSFNLGSTGEDEVKQPILTQRIVLTGEVTQHDKEVRGGGKGGGEGGGAGGPELSRSCLSLSLTHVTLTPSHPPPLTSTRPRGLARPSSRSRQSRATPRPTVWWRATRLPPTCGRGGC